MPDVPAPAVFYLLMLVAVAGVLLWLGFDRRSDLDRARVAIARGDYAAARVWAERAAERAGNDLALAQALDQLGSVHRFMGANGEAEDCYRRALRLREDHLPPDDGDIGASLHNIALSLLAVGRAAEAEPLFRRALAILGPARGDDHPDVALALGGLGKACMYTGKFDESAGLLDRSLRLTEQVFGRDHPRTAQALLRQAGCAMVRGRFHPADRAYRACRAVHDRVHGPGHPAALIAAQQHANLLVGWARLTGDPAALAEAEGLAERFVERAGAGLGPGHHLTGAGLRTLARVRTLQHRPAEAVGLAREALRITEAVLGPDHMRSGLKRLTLARALDEAGELAEAGEHAERAREVYLRVFGPDDHTTGDVYEMLGRLAARRGQFPEALALLRRSLSVREPLGPTHPQRAFTLRELAPVLRETGQHAEAARVESEIATIVAEAGRES